MQSRTHKQWLKESALWWLSWALQQLTVTLLPFWALNVVVVLLSMQGQKALGFKNVLICVLKINKKVLRFGTTWAWVINDRILIFGWTNLLTAVSHVGTQKSGLKKIFDPLLILYVCPLTKKWSVYNFNGRFIWTVRDRITTKKPEKHI